MNDNREARYAEAAEAIGTYLMGAMAEATVGVREVDGWEKAAAREAAQQWLAPLVDAEQAEMRAEVERLRDVADRLRQDWLADLTNVRGIARAQRHDALAAEAALMSEREAHAGLRARLEALADDLAGALAVALYDAHPVYANTTGWRGGVGGQAITQGCSMIDPPPQQEWLEAGLDLLSTPLRAWIQERPGFDLAAAKARVEAQARAVLAPVAAEEGGEQEAGEAPQQYATSHGFTPSVGNPFADPEQCKVMLARYVCPYSREEHDPALPPVDVDVFGYRRTPRPAPSGSDEQGNRPATPDANGVHDTKGGE